MNTTNKCVLIAIIVGSLITGGLVWLLPPGTHPGVFFAVWLLASALAFKSATDQAARRKTLK